MTNFFKGILGGIGNIVPGLSGGALLVILGVYQNALNAITELFKLKNIKENLLYLIPIGIGVAVGTVIFGKILLVALDNYPMQTSYTFVGFLIGTVPMLFKEANKEGFDKKYLIPLGITFILGIILLSFQGYAGFQSEELTTIQGGLLGLVLAGSTIIPGISSTVLLSIIGYYDYYLAAVSSIDILALAPIIVGLGIGAIFFIFLMNTLLKKYYSYTYYAVSGFCIATIPAVLRGTPGFNLATLVSVLCAIIAFVLTYSIDNIKEK